MRGRLLLLLLLLLFISSSAKAQTQNCIASAIAGGTANALTISQLPCSAASALVLVTASAANTGAATLQITGVLPVPIQKGVGVSLAAGDIPGSGFTMMLVNAGQTWKMLNPASGAGGAPGGITDAVQFNAGSLAFGGTSVIANAILGTDAGGVPNETQTLPSTVQNNITSLGTIGSGVWNGTAVDVGHGGTGLTSGTAGGLLAFSASNTLVSTPALTSGLPIIGQGSSIPTVGTVSGNTTKFGTVSGAFVAGNFIKSDASGNLVDAGGGTGQINAGTNNQIAYYASSGTTLSGTPLSTLLDTLFGGARGDILFRNATTWTTLTPGTAGTFLQTGGTGADVVWATPTSSTFLTNYMSGCTLSNDGGSPNSVIDIAVCQAADNTNAVFISLGAFTKSTAGAWAAGTGSNGMGNGLTVANSTWYFICLANNGGTPDVYLDTAVACSNRPTGITDVKVRRVGEFKTNGSAQIITFTQVGNQYLWSTSIHDVNTSTVTSTPTLKTLSVPTGLQVEALYRPGFFSNDNNTAAILIITSPSESDQAPAFPDGPFSLVSDLGRTTSIVTAAEMQTVVDTSGRVRVRTGSTSGTLDIWTKGWIDNFGR